MTVWFTADTHFAHKNILKLTERPFVSVEEMDEALIENWNKVVRDSDTVWHLGDFAFANPEPYASRLRGRKHLILGNHDTRWVKRLKGCFETVQDVKYLKAHNIFLSHYAHRVWPKSHYGSTHLYGHSHGALDPQPRSLDVGVDSIGCCPVALEDLDIPR